MRVYIFDSGNFIYNIRFIGDLIWLIKNISIISLCADGVSTGTVVLTKEQARIVDFVTNPSNWNDAEVEEYSGSFCIDIDTPMEIDN